MAAVPIVGLIGGIGLGEGLVPIVILATTGFVVPAAIRRPRRRCSSAPR
jgi:hypothetical protein